MNKDRQSKIDNILFLAERVIGLMSEGILESKYEPETPPGINTDVTVELVGGRRLADIGNQETVWVIAYMLQGVLFEIARDTPAQNTDAFGSVAAIKRIFIPYGQIVSIEETRTEWDREMQRLRPKLPV